jgi:hypothetical protein
MWKLVLGKWKVFAALGVCLAVFGAGYSAGRSSASAKLASQKAEYEARIAAGWEASFRVYQQAVAEAEVRHREIQQEIDSIRERVGRVPDVIRVRVPASCPPDGGSSPSPGPGAEGGGVFHEAAGDLDIRGLRRLAREADELNANYRGLLKACKGEK